MQYSIVKFNNIKNIFRLDAEYFHPFALKYESLINQHHRKTFSDLNCKVVSGPFGSSLRSNAYIDSGVPFIRISDLKDFFIFRDNIVYISERDNNRLSSSQLKVGDLVLSKVGNTIGIVSKITVDIGNCNISENNLGIRFPRNISDSFRDYILSYLNSKIGQTQILRLISGNAQPKLNVYDIENLFFPIFSDNFYNQISNLIVESFKQVKSSKILYKHAEQLLLSELELLNWKPKHELAFVKNFSATQKAERFDAEYFQPKYEEIIESVKKYKGGYDELGNLVKIRDKNFTPKDNETYKYIELSNISSNGEINGYMENFGNELPSRARRKVQKGNIIISSIEGSLESIALITENWTNALCSTGFFVVDTDKINSETLLVLMKTKIGQLQLKRGCKGTILTAIGKDELSNITLPNIDSDIQIKIKDKIIEMYRAKHLSKSLLEIAKRGVEIAIEKNEEEAEKWIHYELEKIGGNL